MHGEHGSHLTTLPGAERLRGFIPLKAKILSDYRRTPDQVTEEFIPLKGTVYEEKEVDGKIVRVPQKIDERRGFLQHWGPVAEDSDGNFVDHPEPTKKVFVMAPGYQQTGRNAFTQVDRLSREGHDVFTMDEQWAGYTTDADGKATPGNVDRGYGIARDVAAAAAHAYAWARAKYGDDAQVILVGHSMGGGPGVLGALALNEAGLMHLEGPQMPRGMSAILQAPYFAATPSLLDRGLMKLGKVPIANNLPVKTPGVPVFTDDHVAQRRFADGTAFDGTASRLKAFGAPMKDLEKMLTHVRKISGRVYVVQEDNDSLAYAEATKSALGPLEALGRVRYAKLPSGTNHDIPESPGLEDAMFGGIPWVTAKTR
jgi:pimeloyl-ACP methyl ester carboxylesterase